MIPIGEEIAMTVFVMNIIFQKHLTGPSIDNYKMIQTGEVIGIVMTMKIQEKQFATTGEIIQISRTEEVLIIVLTVEETVIIVLI